MHTERCVAKLSSYAIVRKVAEEVLQIDAFELIQYGSRIVRLIQYGSRIVRLIQYGSSIVRLIKYGSRIVRLIQYGSSIVRLIQYGSRIVRLIQYGSRIVGLTTDLEHHRVAKGKSLYEVLTHWYTLKTEVLKCNTFWVLHSI